MGVINHHLKIFLALSGVEWDNLCSTFYFNDFFNRSLNRQSGNTENFAEIGGGENVINIKQAAQARGYFFATKHHFQTIGF